MFFGAEAQSPQRSGSSTLALLRSVPLWQILRSIGAGYALRGKGIGVAGLR
jgi:hypothetical protein